MAQTFEFTDKEIVEMLFKHLAGKGKIEAEQTLCSIPAKPSRGWGTKGFSVLFRVEDVSDDEA